MAPWPNRLLSSSPSNSPSTSSPSPSSAPRRPSRLTEADILENALGIPTLPPSKHPHARSLSHPFPALFAGRKKLGGEAPVDDALPPAAQSRSGAAPSTTPKPSTRVLDRDLVTGKCMTCDSMVRWPKELLVFRCTVCSTINDLQPVRLEVKGDGQRVVKTEKGKGIDVAPLSIERTRQIVDQCITTYLLERLKHTDGDASGASTLGRKGIARSEDSKGRAKATRVLQPSDAQADHHSEIPILTANIHHGRRGSSSRQKSGAGRDRKGDSDAQLSADNSKDDHPRRGRKETSRSMFEPLEDYIVTSFGTLECINNSFIPRRHSTLRTASEAGSRNTVPLKSEKPVRADEVMSELDPKTLLLGDIAENGSWWTGERAGGTHSRSRTHRSGDASYEGPATIKSPRIDWPDVNEWYYLVLNAGRLWRLKLDELTASELYPGRLSPPSSQELDAVDAHIMAALGRTHRVLLKATESLLKRPGRPLYEPNDLRFLLIILANPLLYPSHTGLRAKERSRSRSRSRERKMSYDSNAPNTSKDRGGTSAATSAPPLTTAGRGNSGKHSGIIKRILGLLSNVPNECHHHLVSWFARYSDGQFQRATDLIGSFVTYRLTRQDGQKREVDQDPTADLIPSMSGSGRNTSAALHAALGSSSQSSKKIDGKPQPVIYNDDWQIKAAARVMALFFSANNSGLTRRGYAHTAVSPENGQSAGLAARERAHNHGQILPTSNFYNTLLDYSDLIADFEAWEGKRGKFTFCQYPFFLSIWAKIQIMEHDARRQMEVKAREAFFDSIMTHKNVNQYLVLKIRRDCLVEDSLKGVSEVVGSGDEEIKKGLRIEFKGEEGIDAGGLRKEWFLLLVRDVFNPEHGMFTYDEDSHFCYFNPHSFETTDQFFLVGVVLGLAIYNSTILDVALPPFAFRKLLAAGPAMAPGATSHAKPLMIYTLEDLAEYRPALAAGLRQLLEFDGDVENTFCRDFVADIERYGQTMQVPLCPDGEKIPVTNSNRREFVDLYVRYLLEVAVVRQFEPFKRGFFTVCGGNALSLFRPEEIELLIRGSDEPLDIASLRAVAVCENWGGPSAAEAEPVVQWFWESFETANPKDQRKLLSFITGSDRIPAMGATNLVIKLSCLGEDCRRFPVARTCFNTLALWRYSSRQKLETMLWRAVNESEGFGLK